MLLRGSCFGTSTQARRRRRETDTYRRKVIDLTTVTLDSDSLGRSACRHGPQWGSGIAVSVLILNWNGRRYLGPCITSVVEQSCSHVEVLLVDNGSTDDSVQAVRRDFPGLHIVAHPNNLGFSEGYNLAVGRTFGRFIAFLNNDTVVGNEWLAPLIDELISDPKVAIATSKLLFMGSHVVNATGGQLKLWQGGSDLGFGDVEPSLSTRRSLEPFFASGAAMAISKNLFESLGGFDGRLWAYGEDLDLSWRARLAGRTVRCVPQSVVNHHYSGSFGVLGPAKVRMATGHYVAVMIKCLSPIHLLHSLPAYVMYALAKGGGLALIERNPAYLLSTVLGLRDTAVRLHDVLRQRRETQRGRMAPDRQVFRSDGFGLFESPWALVRNLKQTRSLNRRQRPATDEDTELSAEALS